jgi:hypothetical protein
LYCVFLGRCYRVSAGKNGCVSGHIDVFEKKETLRAKTDFARSDRRLPGGQPRWGVRRLLSETGSRVWSRLSVTTVTQNNFFIRFSSLTRPKRFSSGFCGYTCYGCTLPVALRKERDHAPDALSLFPRTPCIRNGNPFPPCSHLRLKNLPPNSVSFRKHCYHCETLTGNDPEIKPLHA